MDNLYTCIAATTRVDKQNQCFSVGALESFTEKAKDRVLIMVNFDPVLPPVGFMVECWLESESYKKKDFFTPITYSARFYVVIEITDEFDQGKIPDYYCVPGFVITRIVNPTPTHPDSPLILDKVELLSLSLILSPADPSVTKLQPYEG